jgi:hypothetical protein
VKPAWHQAGRDPKRKPCLYVGEIIVVVCEKTAIRVVKTWKVWVVKDAVREAILGFLCGRFANGKTINGNIIENLERFLTKSRIKTKNIDIDILTLPMMNNLGVDTVTHQIARVPWDNV